MQGAWAESTHETRLATFGAAFWGDLARVLSGGAWKDKATLISKSGGGESLGSRTIGLRGSGGPESEGR